MDAGFDTYHVDPSTTRGDTSGRYPPNFVKFSWLIKSLNSTDNPAQRLGETLLNLFDMADTSAARWGSPDEIGVLRENLALFSERMDANRYISPVGRMLAKTMMETNLKNRAEAVAFYEANRSFIEVNGRFEAPLIVTGFLRTGTTLLHRLLSEDPATRSPYAFELEYCVPPLTSGMDPMQDPRLAKSATRRAALSKMAPGFFERLAESHPTSATEREESMLYVQEQNGVMVLNALSAGRDYLHRILSPRTADALFKYERNFFTMLDAYCPVSSHWTLKAPTYAPYFSRLFEHYPDARVVVMHRHPAKTMASACRLLETCLLPFDRDGSFDKVRLGDIVQRELSVFLSAPLDHRAANPGHEPQIIDCMYPDLMRDPIAVVRRIYGQFDLEYTTEFESRMKRYLDGNEQGKHGRHQYSNEEYGIVPQTLYANNKAYFDRYGFDVEAGEADWSG